MENKIEKGDLVKDKITGFEGIVTGHADYITGCDQWLVQPKCEKNHTLLNSIWMDDGRLEIVKKSVISPEEVEGEELGADKQAPIK